MHLYLSIFSFFLFLSLSFSISLINPQFDGSTWNYDLNIYIYICNIAYLKYQRNKPTFLFPARCQHLYYLYYRLEFMNFDPTFLTKLFRKMHPLMQIFENIASSSPIRFASHCLLDADNGGCLYRSDSNA